MNSPAVTPANITSAAIISQFGILAITVGGWLFIRRDHRFASLFRDRPHYIHLGVILLIFALVSLGLLFISDAFANSWLPLFGQVGSLGLSWSRSIAWLFAVDIIFLTVFVFMTGGSQDSPFNSMYFLLPTLALFLREPPGRVLNYVTAVCVSFVITLYAPRLKEREEDYDRRRRSYAFVTLASFAVGTIIGYITRPL